MKPYISSIKRPPLQTWCRLQGAMANLASSDLRGCWTQDGSMMNRILAKLGLSVVLKMMLVDNLVHADLHPGNILVCAVSLSS